jgi:hypothetical protein
VAYMPWHPWHLKMFRRLMKKDVFCYGIKEVTEPRHSILLDLSQVLQPCSLNLLQRLLLQS